MLHLTQHFDLFGIEQGAQALQASFTTPTFPGSALTGNTRLFRFSKPHLRAARAEVLGIWSSVHTGNYLQIISMADGPSDIQEMGRIQGNGSMTPNTALVDITEAFNALVEAGADRHIGFRCGGVGQQISLNGVVLRLTLELPEFLQAEGPIATPTLEHPASILKRIKQWEAEQIQVPE